MLIKKNKDLLTSQMDDELVMMDLESNNYFGLNKVGKDIWEYLEEDLTLDNLILKLTKKYDVSFEQCANDIKPFIEKLKELKIIEIF